MLRPDRATRWNRPSRSTTMTSACPMILIELAATPSAATANPPSQSTTDISPSFRTVTRENLQGFYSVRRGDGYHFVIGRLISLCSESTGRILRRCPATWNHAGTGRDDDYDR